MGTLIAPIDGFTSIHATIALPGVDVGKLKAAVGTLPADAIADNAFAGAILDNAIALVQILNGDGVPVMLAIRPPDLPGQPAGPTSIEISAKSTAVAFAYLMPLIARDDPSEQRPTLELIGSLPETDDLAGRIDAVLRRDIQADPLADAGVGNGVARVVGALLDRLPKQNAAGKIVIRPGNGSDVTVTESADGAGMFRIVNFGRRAVGSYVGPSGDFMPLPSMGPLLDLGPLFGRPAVAPVTGLVHSDAAATDGDTVTVYGLGAACGAPDAAEADRWATPAAQTLWMNLARPLLKVILSVPDVSDDAFQIFQQSVRTSDMIARFVRSAQDRDYGAAVLNLTDGFVKSAQAEDNRILRAALQPYFGSGAAGSATAAASALGLPLKIVSKTHDGVNFGTAIADIVSAKWKETFSLSPFPIASDTTVTVPFETETTITVASANPGGVPVTFAFVAGPSHGTIRAGGTGPSYPYTPAAGYSGPDSFTFQLTVNGADTSNVGTVNITVLPRPNAAPIAIDYRALVLKNSQGRVVTLSATDPDQDPVTYSVVALPTHGTLTLPSPGGANVTYVPGPDFVGTDSFGFKANDGRVDSNVGIVTIKVTTVASIIYENAACSLGETGGGFEVAVKPVDPDGEFVGDQIPPDAFSFNVVTLAPGNIPVTATTIPNLGVIPPSTQGLRAVLVVDDSKLANLEDPGGSQRRAAANAFFDNIGSNDRVAVLDYGPAVSPPLQNSRMLQNFTNDVSLLRGSLGRLTAEGEPTPYGAVREGLGMLPPNGAAGPITSVLILITDAEADDAGAVESTIGVARARNIPVYAVSLGRLDFTNVHHLADATGGTFLKGTDSNEIVSTFDAVYDATRGQVIVFGSATYPFMAPGSYTLSGNLITDVGVPPQFVNPFTAPAVIP